MSDTYPLIQELEWSKTQLNYWLKEAEGSTQGHGATTKSIFSPADLLVFASSGP
jgi:hypothetical protein